MTIECHLGLEYEFEHQVIQEGKVCDIVNNTKPSSHMSVEWKTTWIAKHLRKHVQQYKIKPQGKGWKNQNLISFEIEQEPSNVVCIKCLEVA